MDLLSRSFTTETSPGNFEVGLLQSLCELLSGCSTLATHPQAARAELTDAIHQVIHRQEWRSPKAVEVFSGILDRVGPLNVFGGGLKDALREVLRVRHVEDIEAR